MAARRLHLPLCHEHRGDGGVREGNRDLPGGELGTKVEWGGLPRLDGDAVCQARPGTAIDVEEMAVLLDDPRVLGGHAGALQDDVVARGAADRDLLSAEAGNHRPRSLTRGRGRTGSAGS